MRKALVIEDSLSDLRKAAEILRSVGVNEVEQILSVQKACVTCRRWLMALGSRRT